MNDSISDSLFNRVLSRADSPTLAQLIRPEAARLIQLIDPKLYYPVHLSSLVSQLRSPAELLNDPAARSNIIDLLRPPEARELAQSLGIANVVDNGYTELKQFNFRRAPAKERLLAFFGVPNPLLPAEDAGAAMSLCASTYNLFPHQIDILSRSEVLLAQEPNRVLLHMPTGAGKTRTAINLVANRLRNRPQAVAIWLAHSEELCSQAADEFVGAWKSLGNRDLNLYRFWGAFESDWATAQDGLIVAGFSKLFARTKANAEGITRLATRKPFVVVDEAHQAVAPTYRLLLDILVDRNPGSELLGLTATPGRSWNDISSDEKLAAYFSHRKVTLQIPGYENPIRFLIDQGYLAFAKYRRLVTSTAVGLTATESREIEERLDLPEQFLARLALSEQRNLQIVAEIESLSTRHSRILVFAASLDQSELLATILNARGIRARSVTSRNSRVSRNDIIDSYKQADGEPFVLCNYGILTTGFDAPSTSAALIARPTLSLVLYSQMVGRAMRGVRAGGNAEAEIVTVIDPQIPGFSDVESAFSNWEDVWQNN